MDATKQQRLTLATSTEGTCILKFFPRIFSCIGSSSNLRLVCSSIAHEVEEYTIFLKIVPYRPEDYSLLSIHNLLVRIITKHPHAKHLDLSDPLLRSNYGREDFVALGWDLYALFRSRLETLIMIGGENTILSLAGRSDYFSSYRPSPLLSIATAVDVLLLSYQSKRLKHSDSFLYGSRKLDESVWYICLRSSCKEHFH